MLSQLQKTLSYQFRQVDLLELALTHRSASTPNNERLEFLGDSILNCVIAERLYRLKPEADEGSLSRMRAQVVKKDALGRVSEQLNLGKYLRLGEGERKSGGSRRESIRADALEAISGAAYLDSGFDEARDLILRHFEPLLEELREEVDLKDPKTRLQEYLQARHLELPRYEVVDVTGKEHEQTFTVSCLCDAAEHSESGIGTSRRKAEQNAAKNMMQQLSGKSNCE